MRSQESNEAMPRILIIDDDDHIRSILRQFLEMKGYDVDDADDGNVGIARYRQNPADLVITDVLMPGKEGIETIRDLRRDFPAVKIIAISGGGQLGPETYLHLAEALGARKIFTKPFALNEFLQGVEDVLEAS